MHVKQNSDKAKEIIKNMLTYRKKNKACYQKKSPTPFDFWDQEIKSQFRYIEENSVSSMALQKHIADYIAQSCANYAGELATGQIPDTFAAGIEFYINYILRIIQLQVPDNDIANAMNTRSNMLDALTEYTLGQLVSVLKLVFYSMYNPESGSLIENREQLLDYMVSDLKSWGTIVVNRIKVQFAQLNDPLFSVLVNSVVMNAMFVIATPLLQNELRRLHRIHIKIFMK